MANGPVGKVRNPWGVIGLSIITLGIYALYWQYAVFKEMKGYSSEGIGGGLGLLFAILLGIVNVFLMPAEVGNLYAGEGQEKPVHGPTGLWVSHPDRRGNHLGDQGPRRPQPLLGGAWRNGDLTSLRCCRSARGTAAASW